MRDTVSAQAIRIGYVIGQLIYGGAERQLYELVRGLDPTHFRCFVYCLSERLYPYGDMLRKAGAELRVLKRHGHFDLTRVHNLARLMHQDRLDIVHSYLFLANGYVWAAQRLAGVPYLVTSARNCKKVGLLRGWINRLAFQRSHAIVCNGEAVRAYTVQYYGAPVAKSVVICNGVDLERFSASSDPMSGHAARGGPTDKLVLTIGRLVPQKDLDLFLEAALLLTQTTPGVRFLIVGDGPCRQVLEQRAVQNGLDGRVAFLGERGDIPLLLGTADVFWLTSAWEGFPNVLLEAMACAKPVVTRDVGACRELVSHGVNGYLVSTRDASTFAAFTRDLLANPAQAHAMGQAGRRLVAERFSVAAMVQATARLYGALLESRVYVRSQATVP